MKLMITFNGGVMKLQQYFAGQRYMREQSEPRELLTSEVSINKKDKVYRAKLIRPILPTPVVPVLKATIRARIKSKKRAAVLVQ